MAKYNTKKYLKKKSKHLKNKSLKKKGGKSLKKKGGYIFYKDPNNPDDSWGSEFSKFLKTKSLEETTQEQITELEKQKTNCISDIDAKITKITDATNSVSSNEGNSSQSEESSLNSNSDESPEEPQEESPKTGGKRKNTKRRRYRK